MTEDEALEAIHAYDDVVALALTRAKEWGAWIREEASAKVYISTEDNVVIQCWYGESGDWDSCATGCDEDAIPVAFVFGDDAKRAEMLSQKKAEQARERAEQEAAWRHRREAEERRAYLALKAKFDG